MPQMAPLPWVMLLTTSTVVMITIMTIIYFETQIISLKKSILVPKLNLNNWSW
uniref:ATP synthase F0 subunit 8 n=1 Tax=Eubranchipus grubii TaxID=381661 RepID=A0A7D7IVN7_9CRUS|nr:ATP synthase F0 subunit 8 [Eubranchipus grubii]QMP96531.1 ATP synthase F0 subunit 8 [Eubranchipus grubii]